MVLYGYQGSDTDAEQLALTELLFDAALAELAVVAWGSPCLLAGDFNVEPTKIPCLWVDLDAAWSATHGRHPVVTCKRSWVSACRPNGWLLVSGWVTSIDAHSH